MSLNRTCLGLTLIFASQFCSLAILFSMLPEVYRLYHGARLKTKSEELDWLILSHLMGN